MQVGRFYSAASCADSMVTVVSALRVTAEDVIAALCGTMTQTFLVDLEGMHETGSKSFNGEPSVGVS